MGYSYPVMLTIWVVKRFYIKATGGHFLHEILGISEQVPEFGWRRRAAGEAAAASYDGDGLSHVSSMETLTTHLCGRVQY